MSTDCLRRCATRFLSWRAIAVSFVCGTVMVLPAGCGAEGLLGPLMGYVPTEEELAEYSERIEALESIEVRIVNQTDVLVSVEIESGVEGLAPELFDVVGGEVFLTTVASSRVLISPGGAATGSVKCGDLIVIAVRAPFDGSPFGFGSDDRGLYVQMGNVQLDGAGSGNETFTGDIVSTVRFLVPDEDGVDCASATLVIEIDTPATEEIIDENTGTVIQPAVPGSGTLSLE